MGRGGGQCQAGEGPGLQLGSPVTRRGCSQPTVGALLRAGRGCACEATACTPSAWAAPTSETPGQGAAPTSETPGQGGAAPASCPSLQAHAVGLLPARAGSPPDLDGEPTPPGPGGGWAPLSRVETRCWWGPGGV